MAGEALGILLISGGHERAHYAFVLASGAAAIGRGVVLFATNQGCRALLADLAEFAEPEAEVTARNVASLEELREAAQMLGVRMIVCEAGLRMADLDSAALLGGVELAGVVTFLEAVGAAQVITL
ncbi:MAG: DsrE/DsrF/DrsH-like family protein [Acetobacteraceae bacterium]|nr:DsrE/DsrF/DrsH-like family protein [Acetobacteraceae bacterium]